MTDEVFRVYAPPEDEFGKDGYPRAWHETVKNLVREQAGHRCVRCHHPYRKGQHPMERDEDGTLVSWSPCDTRCEHAGPYRIWRDGVWEPGVFDIEGLAAPRLHAINGQRVEARARILTVHHLNGDKADCRWWNVVALCQRCHLSVQGRVVMARVWPWEHSDWFKPYVAGFYALVYEGREITREEAVKRADELLAYEKCA